MTTVPADPERLAQLLSELEDLDVAVKIVEGHIQTETRLASNKLIDSVRPEITRLGQKFANAYRDLHTANLDFDEYIDALEDAGASVGVFRIRPNGLSHPKDMSGSYAYGLKEFVDLGFFSTQYFPKVLK
jgi:hypothetical protein